MNETNLKPCPNCGKSGRKLWKVCSFDGTFLSRLGKWHIECPSCHWCGKTKVFLWRAKMSWNRNRRATDGKAKADYEIADIIFQKLNGANFDDVGDAAVAIYRADYRKQSEGAWKAGDENGQYGYYCSNCKAGFTGENAEWIAKEHDFCPKCGAKMKGANNGKAFFDDLIEIFDEEYENLRLITPQNTAEKLIAKGYRKQEWISVEERLPENDYDKHWKDRKRYLVFTEPSGIMFVATYGYEEHDWWVNGDHLVLEKRNYRNVTHWMPLPPLPKGERHDS